MPTAAEILASQSDEENPMSQSLSCFFEIHLHVPEHLHHLIPPEFLEKPPEPTEP